ncbi:MAG: hypothetical protein H6709_01310 [Kofleriaceae bacterium]|nr:hypothetical protein [Kofleriaceae bacterium]
MSCRPRTAALAALAAGVALAAAACGDDGAGLGVADECNPLGLNHCMTPWPWGGFEVENSATPSGYQLDIPMGALPTNASGFVIDPAEWNRADGFSPAAPIVVSFPGGVSPDNLVPYADYPASLADASPTVILDMETGERVVHFAELDVPAADDPDRQALYLRPAQRLEPAHRYAVALRKSLRRQDGAALPVSAGFQALLDGTPTSHPLLERWRPHFAEVMDALATAGIPRDDVLLAWDFTTASDDFILHDALTARDRALAALDATPPDFEVFGTEELDGGTMTKIVGEYDAPLFLSNGGAYQPRTVLVRDGAGDPELQGMYRAPFTATIPQCARDAATPVAIMIYGHGLMGESDQTASGSVRDATRTACVVAIGTDMRGMSSPDIGNVARALSDANHADEIFEVLVQGLINHVALVRVAQTAMAARLFVDDPDGPGGNPPRTLVDPSRVYYYGLSQGGIFGTPVIALDPVIERGVVGVAAGNYSMMLERSTDWPTYRTILLGAYPDTLDLVLMINLMQMRWDKTEGSGFAARALSGEGLGTGPNQIMLHMGRGDDEVPNIATHWLVRSMGMPLLTPSTETPWGIPTSDGPIAGSGMVVWDGGAPETPVANIPAPETGAHYVTRQQPASWREIAEFFDTGEIVNECDGACECPDHCQ